jgi:hypothetical protein
MRARKQGEDFMAMELDLIAPQSLLETNAEGEAAEVGGSATRTFLCTLMISNQIEQESLDVSIWGSADGQSWGAQPILRLPQRFYRGETRAVLELAFRPEVKFIRAKWELNKWGRGAPVPTFRAGLHLAEIPAMPVPAALQSAAR